MLARTQPELGRAEVPTPVLLVRHASIRLYLFGCFGCYQVWEGESKRIKYQRRLRLCNDSTGWHDRPDVINLPRKTAKKISEQIASDGDKFYFIAAFRVFLPHIATHDKAPSCACH